MDARLPDLYNFMIYGIGVDVVAISRIRRALKRWGERFTRRIFTDEEVAYCMRKRDPVPNFAVRFAAKEAFFKALGRGQRRGIRWKEVGVRNDGSGRPSLQVNGDRQALMDAEGIARIHLALSHDGDSAIAYVTLEKT